MKKKVRVYAGGGTVPYCYGGATLPNKAMGGQPPMTQDSDLNDNIPGQKTSSFLDFLKVSTEQGVINEQIKQQKAAMKEQEKMLKAMAQDPNSMQPMQPMAQDGYSQQPGSEPSHLDGRYIRPGATGSENEMKLDPNLSAWMGAYQNSSSADWQTPMNTLYRGAQEVAMTPEQFKMELPEGVDQRNFFEQYVDEDYQNPTLSEFSVTGYEKKGRNRVLKYHATGDQKLAGTPPAYEGEPVQDPNVAMEENRQSREDVGNILNEDPNAENLVPGVNQNNSIWDMPSYGNSPTPPVDPNYVPNQNQDLNKFIKNNQGLFDAIGNFQRGGYMPKAQEGLNGVWFPDSNPQMYGSEWMQDPNNFGQNPDLGTTHGSMDWLNNLNQGIANQTGNPDAAPEYDPLGVDSNAPDELQDRTVEEDGEIFLKRQSRFKTADQNNPYLATQASIAGMQLATNIGNLDDRFAQEAGIRERVSNVHRTFGTKGADRGDYMANVPGMGDFLKPNQHTRMGYDTKVAQDGAQIGEEMDLRQDEIEALIAQGYELEYLD